MRPEPLAQAVQRTIREWDEASKMPPLAFILMRVPTNSLPDAKAILPQGDKPPDWVPLDELRNDAAFAAKLKSFPGGEALTNEEQERRISILRKQAEDLTK